MYSNANNLKSEIVWSVSANDSTVSITPGEWVLRADNTVACLEHYENEICTKREVIKITSISDNTLTITRSFAVCVMNDKTKEKGDTAFSFDEWDFVSMYLSKELRESITNAVVDNETARQTMLENLAVPRTCINNCLTTRQSAIDTAYRTKFWWVAWFWNGSDWDCVISEDTFLDAWREYNFRNLTICPDVLVRFEGAGVPTINVRDKFCNLWTIELKAPYVNSASILECWCSCWKEICNKPTDWGACCGWLWWRSECVCWFCWEPWTEFSWWKGWSAWNGVEWWEPDWLNWWTWAYPSTCCSCRWYWWGGWWWGGWRYWNGWDWWRWWPCWCQLDAWWWWNGWNSWLYWKWWTWWLPWTAYASWTRWQWWNGWNWYYWWCWWWSWGCWCAWNWWCWVIEGWHWWDASNRDAYAWFGWNAVTNVYWFHLNARCIYNYCVNARGWKGWEWWKGCGSSSDNTPWCQWWNGADWWQMIVTYCKMIEEGCFDVRGWEGWLWWLMYNRTERAQSWIEWKAWRKILNATNESNVSDVVLFYDSTTNSAYIKRKDAHFSPSFQKQRWKTIVAYSTEDFVENPEDWTIIIEENVQDEYSETPFVLSVDPTLTYYFTFFSYDTNDEIINSEKEILRILPLNVLIVWWGGAGWRGKCRWWWGGGWWWVICCSYSLWWIYEIKIWQWWVADITSSIPVCQNWWNTSFWNIIAYGWWGWWMQTASNTYCNWACWWSWWWGSWCSSANSSCVAWQWNYGSKWCILSWWWWGGAGCYACAASCLCWASWWCWKPINMSWEALLYWWGWWGWGCTSWWCTSWAGGTYRCNWRWWKCLKDWCDWIYFWNWWWWGWYTWSTSVCTNWWNWMRWIVMVAYCCACWYEIEWWEKYLCWTCCYHRFTSDWKLCIL